MEAQIRESRIDLAWTSNLGLVKGIRGSGFLASYHTLVEVKLSGKLRRAKAEWVMDWDQAELEVWKVELLNLVEEQEDESPA